MKKLMVVLMAMAFLMVSATVALAGDTQDVTVTAQITGTCMFNSAGDVDFGALDQSSAIDSTASGSLEFWCTKSATYTLGDETNSGVGDGAFSGSMSNGGTGTIAYALAYNNYTGSGAGKTAPITSTINGTILNADYVDAEAGKVRKIAAIIFPS